MKFISRLAFALSLLAVPAFAFAQTSITLGVTFGSGNCGGVGGICGVASTILFIINNVLIPLLFAIAFLVFLYGIARAYIFSHGDEEAVKSGHRLMLWGIIGFFIMISVWGIVNVVANTFGLTGYGAPPLPNSYGAAGY